jgi:hypothetical protein
VSLLRGLRFRITSPLAVGPEDSPDSGETGRLTAALPTVEDLSSIAGGGGIMPLVLADAIVDGGLVEAEEIELGLARHFEDAQSFCNASSQASTASRRNATLLCRLRERRDAAGACGSSCAGAAVACRSVAPSRGGSSKRVGAFPSSGSNFMVLLLVWDARL